MRAPISDIMHQQISGRKRFYKNVFVKPVEGKDNTVDKVSGFTLSLYSISFQYQITLDGRVLKTPGRNLLHVL